MDPATAAQQLREAAQTLEGLADAIARGEDVRADVEDVTAEVTTLLSRLYGPRPRAPRGEGAAWKMLAYLQAHVGEWVHGDELARVAKIQAWARRVRELRVEHGWRIEEEGDRYRLLSLQPDVNSAAKWKVANSIRRRPGSATSRIAAFFEANVGEIVDRDQLDYVAKIKEGIRRTRELRELKGWPIDSHVDDPELGVSEYRLVSADPKDRRDPRQRLYPENLRAKVFERDNYTCQKCRRDKAKAEAAGDTRFYLEIHHKTAVDEELDALPADELNKENNLITFCHSCHRDETAEFQRRRRAERAGG